MRNMEPMLAQKLMLVLWANPAACDTLAASNAAMASHPVPRKRLLSLSWTHSWVCLGTPLIQSLA